MERIKQAISDTADFNSQLINARKVRGAFYFDPHTNTTQGLCWLDIGLTTCAVIGSWTVDLVVTQEWIDKRRKIAEDRKAKELQEVKEREIAITSSIPAPKGPIAAFMFFSKAIRPKIKVLGAFST